MSEPSRLYDQIGIGYAAQRQADSRWQQQIDEALMGVRTLVNIGAGTGSYEPVGLEVMAVEPARTMIAQRPAGAALAVCAVRGLQEMSRVADRQIVLTWDPGIFAQSFWLVRDYVPEVVVLERDLSTLDAVVNALGAHAVIPLPAQDLTDGVWMRRNAELGNLAELDLGYRLVVAGNQEFRVGH